MAAVANGATATSEPSRAVAGPSRHPRGADTWHPSAYLEPPHPDNEEVVEQAAYQAAVTKHHGERKTRYKPRKTVDYQGGVIKWRQMMRVKGVQAYKMASGVGVEGMHPAPSDLVGLLPAAAHPSNPITSICDQFVHTSINKERSATRIVAWTPDCRRLLTGNDKGQFTLWNGSSFNYESITQVHDEGIRAMSWAHNGQALVSADSGGMIKYFTPHLTNVNGFQGHREACHGVSWSPNDERFVTGGDDGLVKIWDYRRAQEERQLSGHGWDVRCVDWHPHKGLIVSGSKDMLVKFWDPRTGKDISTLHSHKGQINSAKWAPSGHLVSTAGADGAVHLFDIRTFRELDLFKSHEQEVMCIEWHPIHHQIFVTGDAGGSMAYWSLTSPTPSVPITKLDAAHDGAVYSMSFHPMGHLLCSGSKDFTARFWCRPRPGQLGLERDKWHLGEEKSMEARRNGDTGGAQMRQWGTAAAIGGPDLKDEKAGVAAGAGAGLPGLPGLGGPAISGNAPAAGAGGFGGMPGLPGLGGPGPGPGPGPAPFAGSGAGSGLGSGGMPGFGGPGPGPQSNGFGSGSGSAPTRQWGTGPAGGPLPSQQDMMRAGPPGGDRGSGDRGGERDRDRGGPGGYGRGRGDRDRDDGRFGAPGPGSGPGMAGDSRPNNGYNSNNGYNNTGPPGRAPLPPGRNDMGMGMGMGGPPGPPAGDMYGGRRDMDRGYNAGPPGPPNMGGGGDGARGGGYGYNGPPGPGPGPGPGGAPSGVPGMGYGGPSGGPPSGGYGGFNGGPPGPPGPPMGYGGYNGPPGPNGPNGPPGPPGQGQGQGQYGRAPLPPQGGGGGYGPSGGGAGGGGYGGQQGGYGGRY